MDWNAEQWNETKWVSYGHLTDVSYPLTARALYDALGDGLGTGAITDDAELVVNRPIGGAGDEVRQEHLIRRLEVVSERVDRMAGLREVI